MNMFKYTIALMAMLASCGTEGPEQKTDTCYTSREGGQACGTDGESACYLCITYRECPDEDRDGDGCWVRHSAMIPEALKRCVAKDPAVVECPSEVAR